MVIKKNKTLKNLSWYFGGTIVTAILGLVNTPFLTRILDPVIYAQYGMVINLITVLSTFVYLGQDEALMRFYHVRKESYRSFLFRCIKFPILLCLVISAILLEPSKTILKFVFGDSISLAACILLCLYLFVMVIQRFLMVTARIEERAANFSIANITTKAGFLIAIVAFYYSSRYISLSVTIICLLIGLTVALFINLLSIRKVNQSGNANGYDVTTKEMMKYGIPLAISTTMSFSIPLLEKIVVRQYTSWEVLAVYTAASIFITVMNMIGMTVGNIWTPYVFKNYEKEEEFKNIFHNLGLLLTFFIVIIIAGTILTRKWLVMVLAKSYYDVYYIAPAIVCGSCFDILSTVYSVGTQIKNKTINRTIIPVIRVCISMLILFVGLPRLGLLATGLSYLISIGISRFIEIRMGLSCYNTGKSTVKSTFMMLFASAIAGVSLFFEGILFDISIASILVVLCLAVSYKEIFYSIRWLLGRSKGG